MAEALYAGDHAHRNAKSGQHRGGAAPRMLSGGVHPALCGGRLGVDLRESTRCLSTQIRGLQTGPTVGALHLTVRYDEPAADQNTGTQFQEGPACVENLRMRSRIYKQHICGRIQITLITGDRFGS